MRRDACKSRSRPFENEQCSLLGIEGAHGALQDLARGIGEFVLRRRDRPKISNGPEDGEEANEFRVLVHHRRSDGISQSRYNIASHLVQQQILSKRLVAGLVPAGFKARFSVRGCGWCDRC